ncbi:MAG: sensor histidine kinase, partial [Chitinophagales bacterium]
NFVNNFSEVSTELVEELRQEEIRPNRNIVMVQQLLDSIIQNLQKITHHGKRADAIVKGMLQHSQNNSGQKEDTDINQLAEEYLGLSYHGLRAKDKSFNATIKKEFDPGIGLMKIIPQDIGRVLLNIYNNAFYAVAEKKKQNPQGYEATLIVRTRKLRNKIEITVRDNGNGIPEKVMDKIFQPFFTTKPSGQGTGLGLSLSYDIVTKGHGGTMTVNTKEGEYTELTILLPL